MFGESQIRTSYRAGTNNCSAFDSYIIYINSIMVHFAIDICKKM